MKLIITELTDAEYKLLTDILGHTNYDAEESKTFSSMYNKITA
jgi:hypothetical protein